VVRRLRQGDTLVVASHNPGKVRELQHLIRPFGVDVVAAGALGLVEPEETGVTFEENAIIKAMAAASASGLPTLADDSGLSVAALGGDPGIHSARWAGASKDFDAAMREVERRLEAAGATTAEARRGTFVAVLALAAPDGTVDTWRGEIGGTIVWPPRGSQGFGYDPMFMPDGHVRTFGEMSADEKHGWNPPLPPLSHRARAFAAFAADVMAG